MYSFFIDLFQEKSYNNILLSNKQFLSTTINTCSLFIAYQDIGLYINMSKRLWTETRQVGAKNSTQKSSKTKAKLNQAEPS